MKKLTPAQARGLAYFAALDLPATEKRAALRGLTRPGKRVIEALFNLNLIHIVGYSYGPLFRVRAVPVGAFEP